MYQCLQHKPLFVPFREQTVVDFQTKREQYVTRAVKSGLIAFLVAVVLVAYSTNRHEAKLREAKAATVTCQAATGSAQSPNTSHPDYQ